MKVIKNKIYWFFVIILSVFFMFFYNYSFAQDWCMDFDDWSMCLHISQDNNWYQITPTYYDYDHLPIVSCQLRTPERVWATLYYIPWCRWKFEYDWTDWWYFTIYLNYNDKQVTIKYDLSAQDWDDYDTTYYDNDDYYNDNNEPDDYDYNYEDFYENSESDDVDKLYLLVNDSNVDVYQKINIYIKPKDKLWNVVDRYYKTLKFKIYKEDSNWYYNQVGDSYYRIKSSTYDMTFNHQTYETLYDYIYFKQPWKYKIKVYQEDDLDVYWYVYVDVKDDRLNWENELDKFYAKFNDTTPDVDERLDLTLEAWDEYWNLVRDFEDEVKVYVLYKDPYTDSFVPAPSDWYELSDRYIYFNSSEDWHKKIYNFIKFYKAYEYVVIFKSDKWVGFAIADVR